MRAIGQITITNICDVAASDTPPENPYVGQLWVDTSVSPPETKIWNGAEWVVQNDVDTIRVTISVLTTRCAELQSTIDGLNSYVGTMTQTLETVTDALGNEQQTVLEMQAQMSLLQQTIDGLTIQVQNQYAGGLNFIQNSAGLNGVSDDWVKTDTVIVDSSTDTQNNTTSDSCFVLGSSATLKQRPLPGSCHRAVLRLFAPCEEDEGKLLQLYPCPVQRQQVRLFFQSDHDLRMEGFQPRHQRHHGQHGHFLYLQPICVSVCVRHHDGRGYDRLQLDSCPERDIHQ